MKLESKSGAFKRAELERMVGEAAFLAHQHATRAEKAEAERDHYKLALRKIVDSTMGNGARIAYEALGCTCQRGAGTGRAITTHRNCAVHGDALVRKDGQ